MTVKSNPSKVGRPRKNKSDKAEYQHIAIHATDYINFLYKVEESGKKKVEVFHDMLEQYDPEQIDEVRNMDVLTP